MTPTMESHLAAASDALERLASAAERMTPEELADLGGRARGVNKAIDRLRDTIAGRVRIALDNEAGEIVGHDFRAVFVIVAGSRLDVTALREAQPRIANKYTIATKTARLTFDPR